MMSSRQAHAEAIWVAGLGLVCAAGDDPDEAARRLGEGQTAIGPLTLFESPGAPPHLGMAPGLEPRLEDAADRCVRLGVLAGRQALEADQSNSRNEGETAFIFATNLEDAERLHGELAQAIAKGLGVDGPVGSLSVACASGGSAVAAAATLLRSGACERVLVVGADAITQRVHEGFGRLGLLSPEPCEPLSNMAGTTLGEGAGALLLVAGSPPPGVLHLRGWGTSNDAFDVTAPHPRGAGVRAALERALRTAGAEASCIGVVKLHATGTRANDQAEWRGIAPLFAQTPEVCAPKGFVGHTQGAAGAVEAVLTLAGWRVGRIPGAVCRSPDRPRVPPRHPSFEPDPERPLIAALNSGFGGSNAALVFGPGSASGAVESRPVYLAGAARLARGLRAVGPCASIDVEPRLGVREELDLRRVVPGVDMRTEDRSSQNLVLTIHDLLRTFGRGRGRKVGLFVGQDRVSRSQLATLGPRSVVAPAQTFARSFLAYPASLAAFCLGIDGPFCVHTSGAGAGLEALFQGVAGMSQGDQPACIVATVEESRKAEGTDGACALWLAPRGIVRIRSRMGRMGSSAQLGRVLCDEVGLDRPARTLRSAESAGPLGPLVELVGLAGAVERGEIDSACFEVEVEGFFALTVLLTAEAHGLG